MPATRRDNLVTLWPLVVIALFMAMFVLRAWAVEKQYGAMVGCDYCFFLPAIVQDLWVLAIVAALLALILASPWRWFSRLSGLAVSVMMVAYLADVYILRTFGLRLFLADAGLYAPSLEMIIEQFASLAGGTIPAVVAIALIVGLAVMPAVLPRRSSVPLLGCLALVAFASAGMAALGPAPRHVNNWIYKNFLQANAATSESVRYSDPYIDEMIDQRDAILPRSCSSRPPDDRNVIVLIIESWSSYQSAAFGGHLDWTPRLDALARENVRYLRMHAGGSSTNEGLVNILGGVRLWAPFAHLFFDASDFGHAWGIEGGMAEAFNRADFHTAFLTTGPLSFLRKGEWLRDLGFDAVEGNDHPFYDDWEEVTFQAAPDEALYRRALQWMGESAGEPFLLVLETVSTHQPYIHPETGDYDIEGSFRYADHWAAWFHDQLEEAGYFESGVLLIVSDHRSMTPIGAEGQAGFGRAAASRIPMLLVDRQWRGPAVVDRVHGLGDLVPGMRRRLGSEVCLSPIQASPFDPGGTSDSCAFHLRGAERGMVDVFCDSGEGGVVLDGDDTRFVEQEGLSAKQREQILMTIALERIAGLERARRFESDGSTGNE